MQTILTFLQGSTELMTTLKGLLDSFNGVLLQIGVLAVTIDGLVKRLRPKQKKKAKVKKRK